MDGRALGKRLPALEREPAAIAREGKNAYTIYVLSVPYVPNLRKSINVYGI